MLAAWHSFAVFALNKGLSMSVVCRLIGHGSTDVTEKVPLFDTDKWIERQNQCIAKQFTEIVHKIESLYKNDVAWQV